MLKFKLRIRNKLLLLVIFSTAIIFGAFLIAARGIFSNLSKQQSIEIIQSQSEQFAALAKNYFDLDMGYVKAFSNSFQYFGALSENERDTLFGNQMLEMLKLNPKYISVWASFELEFYREGYNKDYGRKLLVAMRQDNDYIITEFYRDMEGRDPKSDYSIIRANDEPNIAEPYVDTDISNDYITSIIYPIHINGIFAGIGGIDIPLSDMQNFINQIKLSEGSFAYIISNTGLILGHSDTLVLGKNIADAYPELVKKHKLIEQIHSAIPAKFSYNLGEKSYYSSVIPFVVEGTTTPWAISINRPLNEVLQQGKRAMTKLLIIAAVVLTLLFLIIIYYARSIVKPLKAADKVLGELAGGNFDVSFKHDDISGITIRKLASSVDKLIGSLHQTVAFAEEIEKGNLEAEFKIRSERDNLGKALINMQQGLLSSKQLIDAGREQGEKEAWVSNGLAKFALFLRADSTDFAEFCRIIIAELVNYTNSNQGGFYLVNSSDEKAQCIELAASYAFDTEKNAKKRIELGEGLIGVSIIEGKFRHLTEIPEKYLKVSSGLGQFNPAEIIIMPLISDKKILGCIELASFTKYPDHFIQFIKSVAESIAATMVSIELQNKTNVLLEKTQQQAEEMMAQEQELRFSMEEMMANQEKMAEKEEQLKSILKEFNINEEDIKERITKTIEN